MGLDKMKAQRRSYVITDMPCQIHVKIEMKKRRFASVNQISRSKDHHNQNQRAGSERLIRVANSAKGMGEAHNNTG